MDKEHAQRRQARRDDQTAINFALRASHVSGAPQDDGIVTQPQMSEASAGHDANVLGEKWSVHRTRLVSVGVYIFRTRGAKILIV